jgi:uncharacterized UPF0160 family protein
MPELIATLEAKHKEDYENKKFLAALQGVDLDQGNAQEGQRKWEEIKAKVYSKGTTDNPDDIVALQGQAALQAGFGIGLGLDYEVM